ncbi:MAG: MBL fold metallo-hydrolase, partial [Caulobacteraceae bacterium]
MLGVKTIGNATMIAFDGEPILVTDPWMGGSGAYFGSWGLSHRIPPTERDEILRSKFVWLSHGHPDHLDAASLRPLSGRRMLLPDHVGGRILNDLRGEGYDVETMPDRAWVQLSPHIRAMCVSDYYQDAILLIDVGGRLFVNLNDAREGGAGSSGRSPTATATLICSS